MCKKIVLCLLILALTLTMSACVKGERLSNETDTKSQLLLNHLSSFDYTFQDSETGVWYISTGEGVTPRLNADGTLYVTK